MTEWDGGGHVLTHEEMIERIKQQQQETYRQIEDNWQQTIRKMLRNNNISRWAVLGVNILAAAAPLLKEPSWWYLQIPFNLGLGCYFFYKITKFRNGIIKNEAARRLSGKTVLEFHK